MTECSYCPQPASHVGAGQDGDFYCPDHLSKAPGSLLVIVGD